MTTSSVLPMKSARIYAGRYEVLGTSTHCEIRQQLWVSLVHWVLYSNGEFVRTFNTKREALIYCQAHPEL